MKAYKLIILIFIAKMTPSFASDNDKIKEKFNERIKPCMNIKYSPDVIDCMMSEVEKTKKNITESSETI